MASGGTTVTQTVEEPESKKPTGKNFFITSSLVLHSKSKYCQVVSQRRLHYLDKLCSPENLDMSNITEVNFSNFHNSKLAKVINELLSFSENFGF